MVDKDQVSPGKDLSSSQSKPELYQGDSSNITVNQGKLTGTASERKLSAFIPQAIVAGLKKAGSKSVPGLSEAETKLTGAVA